MSLKRRKYSKEFKLKVIRELEAGKSSAQVSREYQIHPTLISKWKSQLARHGENAFAGNGHLYQNDAKIAELERMVGQLTMENALLKKALTKLELHQPSQKKSYSK